ncbi:hypothetical protein BC937DRAFT_94899 [Endogone sp. FLAS-F59071]|nr:hypothetical protein BC937DRAFT_94899 [Endogone sp. FLAS-F59071]|eukprot:RUS13707.1 hypothetical protein BC937DRAFT_94899 [Endogone sp. FLAS-F59071]
MPRSQLCIVCQSFCDRCFRQYCTNCFNRHCELVHCLCPLTAFRNILCYCTECRPEFECPKCRHVYCHDHLVRCVFDRRVVSCRRECAQDPGAQVTVCGVEECWNAFCADECEDRAKEAGWRCCRWCEEWVCGVCVPPGEAVGNTQEGWTCYMCPEREYVVLFGEEDPWGETIAKSVEMTEAENEADPESELAPEPEDLEQSFVFHEAETSSAGKRYAARRGERWHLELEEYQHFQSFYTPWEEGLDRVGMEREEVDSDSDWKLKETEGKEGEEGEDLGRERRDEESSS